MEIKADQASADLLRAAGSRCVMASSPADGRTAVDMQNHTLTYFIEGQRSSNSDRVEVRWPRVGRGTGR